MIIFSKSVRQSGRLKFNSKTSVYDGGLSEGDLSMPRTSFMNFPNLPQINWNNHSIHTKQISRQTKLHTISTSPFRQILMIWKILSFKFLNGYLPVFVYFYALTPIYMIIKWCFWSRILTNETLNIWSFNFLYN